MSAVHRERCGVNKVTRVLPLICAAVSAGAFSADPKNSESGQAPSQPSAAESPQTFVQSPAVAPPGASATSLTTPADPGSSRGPDTGRQPGAVAPLPASATAQPVAGNAGRKTLVDDTVTDAQLKQILRKGYRPERQARGNEVYYCRGEHELGSRFETKVCRTAARILQEEQQGKEATTNVERTDGNRVLK